MEMRQFLEKLIGYLKGVYRYRWIALFASILIAVVGWVMVGVIPDYYRGNARVYIDTQSLLQPLMRDISVSLDPDVRIQKMTRMLLSQPNLERIARMSDLDLEYHSRAEKEAFIKKLESDIQFRQEGRSNLFNLSYDNPDPHVAKLVVQSMLNLFMELTLSDTRTDTVVAQQFLDTQLDEYQQRLIEAEQGLASFKREHIGNLPRQDLTYYQTLQALLQELEQTRLEMAIVNSKRNSLERQLRGEEPILGLTGSNDMRLLHPLIRNLRELEEKYNKFSQFYTDKHPDVIALKAEMKALNTKITQEQDSQVWALSQEELNQNPVFQQIKIQLSEVTSEYASLEAKKSEIEKQVDIMEQKVDKVIETEAKLSNLNRDYLMNKQQYQALLAKREAAKFAEDIDDTAENLKFRIVDPPYVSSMPVWPKRGLFNLAVLLASIIGGFVAALGFSQLKPGFYDKGSIEQALRVPVLATIPFEKSSGHAISMRRQHLLYLTAVAGLMATYVLIYLLSARGVVD